jgi:hypothetical protein
MPRLEHLQIPNAPEPEFFRVDLPELRCLVIGPDYDQRGFIRNLAGSRNLPSLIALDFADSSQPFIDYLSESETQNMSTPYKDFEELFRSPAMRSIRHFTLRNSLLSIDQFRALQALAPELQFKVIVEAFGSYVSHWDGRTFPFAHLELRTARWFGR